MVTYVLNLRLFFSGWVKVGPIYRAYRERKKQALGQDFLKAERERVRQYYVPASLLSKKKRAERNQKNKLRN